MDDGSESAHVDALIIEGIVTDTAGKIIPNAKVEIWHANSLGNYSFFDKSQSDLIYAVVFSPMPMVNISHKPPCLSVMAVHLKVRHKLYSICGATW
jgi:hypothetical protein